MPENFFANNEKAAIFNIFLSKKNFWDPFFSEKTDLAFPTTKRTPRNSARIFFANSEKAAIFHIFLSKKNFWHTFSSQKKGKTHFRELI